MPGTQESILLDQPKEVDVVSIERELTLLWKAATEDGGTGEEVPVVRACSLNLVVVTDDPARLSTIEQLVGDVTLEHPARIFLIQADRSAGAPLLDAWIAARCSVPLPGAKQVCCEQISLNARGSEVSKLSSIVASLLVPDIPTILLWKSQIAPDDPVLSSLADVADRVLVDSSEEPDPFRLLRSMRETFGDRRVGPLYGDLAWSHATAWRAVLAQVFASDEARQQLSSMSAISIDVSSSASPVHNGISQALLLLGWLCSRLRWSVIRPLQETGQGGFDVSFVHDGQEIGARVVCRANDQPGPGGVEKIRLTTKGGLEAVLWSDEDRLCIHTRLAIPPMKPRESILWVRDRDEASVIARELEVLDRDELYEAASAAVSSLFKTQ